MKLLVDMYSSAVALVVLQKPVIFSGRAVLEGVMM
jgi:hypothetical protein